MYITAVLLLATANQTNAFHRHNINKKKDDVDGHPGLFNSLAQVAERGASKWGNYYMNKKSTLLKKSSPFHISQLHQQIQSVQSGTIIGSAQQQSTIISDDLKTKLKHIKDAPSESVRNNMFGLLLCGAASGSAFAGIFIGTFVMSLGAIATVMFEDTTDKAVHALVDGEALRALMMDEEINGYKSRLVEQHIIEEGGGCGYYERGEEEKKKKLPSETLDITNVGRA